MNARPPRLIIENLSKTYANGVRALHEVHLEIPRGMFGLLGPNGAGKSTLMRTLATLQEADQGTIHFGDIDVLAQPAAVRRILGYLPQDFGVYPSVDAWTMLDHLAVLKGIVDRRQRKSTVEALLQRTNLWEKRFKKLGGYSGGMRQRFGIAQALLGNPELLIVDEPTAGLDPEERNRFLDLLSEIGEQVVVILSTHIVEDVSDLCSRMAIIAAGEVLHFGAPAEAIERMRGRTWRKVIDRGELDDHRDRHRVISTRWIGGRTAIHVVDDMPPGAGFAPREPDLEDVYFTTLLQFRAREASMAATAKETP